MAIRNVPPTNDYNASGSATGRRERSFAALYEQARKAAANDDQDAAEETADLINEQNIKRLDALRDNVNTLRGEIIVRVIQSSDRQVENGQATGDISRLSTRLDSLRKKLETEEVRLSGKLIDIKA